MEGLTLVYNLKDVYCLLFILTGAIFWPDFSHNVIKENGIDSLTRTGRTRQVY